MSSPSIVVVAKRSAYGKFLEEDRDPRVRDLLKRADPSVRRWKQAHEAHVRTLEAVERAISKRGLKAWVLHGAHKVFSAEGAQLVVTVGGDGTLLAASHHIDTVPILGVNSAPSHSIGFFCGARATTFAQALDAALANPAKTTPLARMRVDVAGRVVSRRVLNEALFCHAIPAATSRYILHHGRHREEQRSSGVWVGTAAGSTGALRSAGGRVRPLSGRQLQVVVREPYLGEDQPYRMQRLLVEDGKHVTLHNKMHDAWLFLDGPFMKTRVSIGETVHFRLSKENLFVVGLDGRRRRH